MNSNKTLLIIVLTVLAIIVVFFVISKRDTSLISPIPKQVGVSAGDRQSSPAPAQSPNTPKVIKYDSSTDLQKELESINPEILDSDFGT